MVPYSEECPDVGLLENIGADYATCKDDRRSITGFCFHVGSGAISWAASLQTCAATPTTEAGVHALSESFKEAVHLRGILGSLGVADATTLYSDSQSSLALTTREDNSANTKQLT